jgi:hypothetical protein
MLCCMHTVAAPRTATPERRERSPHPLSPAHAPLADAGDDRATQEAIDGILALMDIGLVWPVSAT